MKNLPRKEGCPHWGTNKCMYRRGAESGSGHGTCLFCVSLRLFGTCSLAYSMLEEDNSSADRDKEAIRPLWANLQASLTGGSRGISARRGD